MHSRTAETTIADRPARRWAVVSAVIAVDLAARACRWAAIAAALVLRARPGAASAVDRPVVSAADLPLAVVLAAALAAVPPAAAVADAASKIRRSFEQGMCM